MVHDSARTIRDGIAAGRFSAVEVCQTFLDRIEATNPSLNAFTLVAADRALGRAAEIDRRRAAGETLGPLAGVPVAIKDNLCVRGMRTTASSRILDRFVPPYDATVVERLEAADAVIIGKTNCDEFAMGFLERELGVRSRAQPLGGRPHAWRLERRLGCGGGRALRAARARLGHGRIDTPARLVLRRARAEADVRARIAVSDCSPLRPRSIRSVPWPAAPPTRRSR